MRIPSFSSCPSLRRPVASAVEFHGQFGTGGIVKDGWKISFGSRPDFVDIFGTYPPLANPVNNAGKEVWELYDLNTDSNGRTNLAAKQPAKLKELQEVFAKEAEANHVYPLIIWTDVSAKFRELMKAQAARGD